MKVVDGISKTRYLGIVKAINDITYQVFITQVFDRTNVKVIQ